MRCYYTALKERLWSMVSIHWMLSLGGTGGAIRCIVAGAGADGCIGAGSSVYCRSGPPLSSQAVIAVLLFVDRLVGNIVVGNADHALRSLVQYCEQAGPESLCTESGFEGGSWRNAS